MVMRNYTGSVRGRKGRTYTHTSNQPNVDIWLVGDMELTAGSCVNVAVEGSAIFEVLSPSFVSHPFFFLFLS